MDVLVLSGRIDSSEIPALCARGGTLARRARPPVVYCDVGGVTHADAVCVEALARLQLTIKRLGRELRLLHAGEDLKELIDLVGLCGAVRFAELGLEPGGEAEQGEHPCRVEEETDPADPSL